MRLASQVALGCVVAYLVVFTVGMLLYPEPIGLMIAVVAAVLALVALGLLLYLLVGTTSADDAEPS